MSSYKITDFEIGEKVYSEKNPNLSMIIVGMMLNREEICCEWLDGLGDTCSEEFLPHELLKIVDKV